jgi:hypothetical protein
MRNFLLIICFFVCPFTYAQINLPKNFKLVKGPSPIGRDDYYTDGQNTFSHDTPFQADQPASNNDITNFLSHSYHVPFSKTKDGLFCGTGFTDFFIGDKLFKKYIYVIVANSTATILSSKTNDSQFSTYSKWLLNSVRSNISNGHDLVFKLNLENKTPPPIYDAYPQSKIFITNYNGKTSLASSETGIIFKSSFINLVKSNFRYKEDVKSVVGPIIYRITQINKQFPAIRNNGDKIYNGFKLETLERLDSDDDVVISFIYDIDSNSLFWLDTSSHKCHLQPISDINYLSKCARYCKFEN